MDQIDQAIKAAAQQPTGMQLTLGSSGRACVLPIGMSANEMLDLAMWCQTQLLGSMVGALAEIQERQPKPTVIATPRGQVAVVRKD
jgi:hypothetical protein